MTYATILTPIQVGAHHGWCLLTCKDMWVLTHCMVVWISKTGTNQQMDSGHILDLKWCCEPWRPRGLQGGVGFDISACVGMRESGYLCWVWGKLRLLEVSCVARNYSHISYRCFACMIMASLLGVRELIDGRRQKRLSGSGVKRDLTGGQANLGRPWEGWVDCLQIL